MQKEKLYTQWKQHRRQVQVPENFAAEVMTEIKKQMTAGEYELPSGLNTVPNRFAQWAMAAGLILLGLFRVLYIAANLLRLNPLIPY